MTDAYTQIKQDFCEFITNEQLNALKCIYRENINSVRQLEKIQSTDGLIDILERRGILSKTKLDGFVGFYEVTNIPQIQINQHINQNEEIVIKPVNQYGKKFVMKNLLIALLIICSACFIIILYTTFGLKTAEERTRQPSLYEEALLREELQQTQIIPPVLSPVVINDPTDLNKFQDRKHIIYKMISEDIGRKWRDLGRELRIKEGQLDDLEIKYSNSSKLRALEIFKMFEDKGDPKSIVLDICEALIQIRRNDLRKEVERILIR